MLKLAGICILLFTSILTSRELVSRRRSRLVLCEELLRFVSFLRLQIGCFLRPVHEVASSFHSDVLSSSGFLPVGECGDVGRAFADSDLPRIVGQDCARIADSLFSSLGSGYLEDEVRLIDVHRAQLSELVERERIETERQVRLIRTLTASAALGAIILII